MAAYTVVGHPLGGRLDLDDPNVAEALRAQMQLVGVGGTVNFTLTGAQDTKAKGHGALK